MPIPESQLETWSHQGGTANAQATHLSIRAALAAGDSPMARFDHEIFLQGSYKSDTNVRADSDVDIVVQLNAVFGYDESALSPDEKQFFNRDYPDAQGDAWSDFRRAVLTALRNRYGAARVEERSKCLKVQPGPGYLAADVIPALQFRKYSRCYGRGLESFAEGIRFRDRSGRTITNYPKIHYDNGVAKNSLSRTLGRYKRTVRMFKNSRTRAVERGYLAVNAAPSYFIDSLLWNVPDELFADNLQTTFCEVVNWLGRAGIAGFWSRNGLLLLFGPTPEQWTEPSARALLGAMVRLWNEWY